MNPDLEKWIDEASKGLEPLAREKISEQITEHYQDAIVKYRPRGLDDAEMHRSAMNDLGDPVKALREYGKIFFHSNFVGIIKIMNTTFIFAFFAATFNLWATSRAISWAIDLTYDPLTKFTELSTLAYINEYLTLPKIISESLLILAVSLGAIHFKYALIAVISNNYGINYIKASALGYFVISFYYASCQFSNINNLPSFIFWAFLIIFLTIPYFSIPTLQKYARQKKYLA
jgi:hypothetical protein